MDFGCWGSFIVSWSCSTDYRLDCCSLYLSGWGCIVCYEQVKYGYDGKNFIIRRLRRQQILGAMLLVVAGVMMLCMKRNEWIVCLSAAAVIELYTSFSIPQEEEREKKK